MQSLTPNDKVSICQALERLFILQDKPMTSDKQTVYLSELENTGIPVKALLAGINKLQEDDLKAIKLSTIISASRKFMSLTMPDGCEFCKTVGFITMENDEKYSVAIPCDCERGKWYAKNQNFSVWNGKKSMYLPDFGLMKITWQHDSPNIPEMSDDEFETANTQEKHFITEEEFMKSGK